MKFSFIELVYFNRSALHFNTQSRPPRSPLRSTLSSLDKSGWLSSCVSPGSKCFLIWFENFKSVCTSVFMDLLLLEYSSNSKYLHTRLLLPDLLMCADVYTALISSAKTRYYRYRKKADINVFFAVGIDMVSVASS